MEVSELIKKFASLETLPVEVPAVEQELIACGITDEIYFFAIPGLDTEVLRGNIKHWTYGEDKGDHCDVKYVAEISYADSLSGDWVRLVCCKELLHILDPEPSRVASQDALDHLIEKIILPPELQDATDGHHALTDRIAVIQAVAVLFPLAARDLLMAPFSEGKIALEQVAELADLPARYVTLAMSEVWDSVYPVLVA